MIGFVFVSESEAKVLWKKVIGKDSKGCMSIIIHTSFTIAHPYIS
jgi:hypothetical protein